MANTPNKSNKTRAGYHPSQPSLSAAQLTQQLNQLAGLHNIKTWCLAYSGGVDSQVLLHLLHLTKLNVSAVYIDHGLQAESAEWARHCTYQCELLNIPFQVISVNAQPATGESPEAAARAARYGAFRKILTQDMCLLTAQHQDDQAETVLLQLLRGGSAAGCAAMPKITAFENAWHCRPLLNISQQSIIDYAQKNKLSWIEDPSNQQQNYDRNYLRHSVIPEIQNRWPALNKTLSVFAEQQAENVLLLDELARIDLQSVLTEPDQLDINQLKKLDNARLRNTLRYWIKQNQNPMPSRAVLQQIVEQMQIDSHDTHSKVSWAGVEIRRFREGLYLLKQIEHDASQVIKWDINEVLLLPSIDKTLSFKKVNGSEYALNSSVFEQNLTIRFRQGGEKIKPAGRNGRHDLKSLFQEAGVAVWQRDRIPLLFYGDELVAVVGYWLADGFVVKGEGVLLVLD